MTDRSLGGPQGALYPWQVPGSRPAYYKPAARRGERRIERVRFEDRFEVADWFAQDENGLRKGSDGSQAEDKGCVRSPGEAKQRIKIADARNSGAELTGLDQLVDVHRRSRQQAIDCPGSSWAKRRCPARGKITGLHLNRVAPHGAAPSEHPCCAKARYCLRRQQS